MSGQNYWCQFPSFWVFTSEGEMSVTDIQTSLFSFVKRLIYTKVVPKMLPPPIQKQLPNLSSRIIWLQILILQIPNKLLYGKKEFHCKVHLHVNITNKGYLISYEVSFSTELKVCRCWLFNFNVLKFISWIFCLHTSTESQNFPIKNLAPC